MYRQGPSGLEVLLVHPSGVYNRRAPWGIPKGMLDDGEAPEQAARRETWEETGITAGLLVDLGHIDYTRSRKRVYCFAGPAPANADPHCASWEVDQVCFVPIERARQLMHPDQVTFIDRLLNLLEHGF
ncbi:MAG: NUDIX domain-containing protein [Gemmataceae bacterium]